MTSVFTRKHRFGDMQKRRMSFKDQGRNWRDAAMSQGLNAKNYCPSPEARRRKGVFPEFQKQLS
jgi:hypothetical protein